MEKLLANKRVLQALWTYNEYLNQVYQLDQQFSYEENPLRNFLHTKTPGDPESTQHFFTDLAAYADQIDAKMSEEDREGWDFDLVYDPERSEVAHALDLDGNKKKKPCCPQSPPAPLPSPAMQSPNYSTLSPMPVRMQSPTTPIAEEAKDENPTKKAKNT